MGAVTIGAENIAVKERVEYDLLLGLGLEALHRPTMHAHTVDNPTSGLWKIQVIGFDLNTRNDKFKLRVSADGGRLKMGS